VNQPCNLHQAAEESYSLINIRLKPGWNDAFVVFMKAHQAQNPRRGVDAEILQIE
jgi:hypothetical protein